MRGRLAPSPTGSQHIGNARTYLLAWLSARSQNGEVILRIEDIDVWRNKPYAQAQLLADLHWLGLDYDGEVLQQSKRVSQHIAALETLKQQELVYPCTCSRNDILFAASAPHLEHEGPTYPRTCFGRSSADAEQLKVPYAWRFRAESSPSFLDQFHGPVSMDLNKAGGDFVVWRAANVPAYQLAVVVDDAEAGVTEVVRGDDLLSSTPRQLLLYKALGLTAPAFAHVPMVVGDNGQRLAKRHGDARLSSLAAAGVKPEALLGLLAWSCGWLEKPEQITARELIPIFRWNSVPHEPFQLKAEHLRSMGYAP